MGAAYAGPGAGRDAAPGPVATISFGGGLPDPTLHPVGLLGEAIGEVLATEADPALQYGGAQGPPVLREWIATHESRRLGAPVDPGEITITGGAAAALANVCDTLLDPGDLVAVEAFTFPLSVRTIRATTPAVVPVPVDDHGIDPDALEDAARRAGAEGRPVRALYVIPTFHNPTGTTLPEDRRRAVVEICRSRDILIIEDDAYGELWFDEPPPPSLWSLAGGEGVVRLGSFSKILAPGLRVGWCQAPRDLVAALVATRCDMGTSPLLCRALARAGTSGGIEAHLERIRPVYAAKCRTLLEALARELPDARWVTPAGGFFVWVRLPAEVDPDRLVAAAAAEGVSFVGGHVFDAGASEDPGVSRGWGPGPSRQLRLAFSYLDPGSLTDGVRRIARAVSASR